MTLKSIKIIVVENSNDVKFKQKLNIKYPHIECILTGENKGYSAGNNIGLSHVNSKYSLVLNPDTIVEKNAFNNFLKTAQEYPDFWLIGPSNDQSYEPSTNDKKVFEIENLKGFAIFLNMKKFKKSFFDENYFLYFEESDFCLRAYKINKNYQINKIKVSHKVGTSVIVKNKIEKNELEKLYTWHFIWSKFYYYKKHYGSFYSMIYFFPIFLRILFRITIYTLSRNYKKREKFIIRLEGLVASVKGLKSYKRLNN